jgi:hypothetical protein
MGMAMAEPTSAMDGFAPVVVAGALPLGMASPPPGAGVTPPTVAELAAGLPGSMGMAGVAGAVGCMWTAAMGALALPAEGRAIGPIISSGCRATHTV